MASLLPAISYESISRALKVLPNPVHPLIFSFLFVFTIPLAIFATITTIFAVSILLFRVVLIYIELALAVISYYAFGTQPKATPAKSREQNPAVVQLVPTRRRRRRSSSSSSTMSAGSLAPIASDVLLSQSVGLARDFEGVGGWRLGGPSDDEATWTKSPRLVLPADHTRRHQRSLTSGSVPLNSRHNRNSSPEAVMNTSRARTPPVMGYSDGHSSHMTSKKRTPSVVTVSSESSKGSSGLSMQQR